MPSIYINDNSLVSIKDSCTLILNNNEININYDISGDCYILIFNDYKGNLTINDSGTINSGEANISYIELNNYDFIQNTNIKVNDNATLNINSTYLGANNKRIVYDLYNIKSFSSININNNIVCLDKADFSLDCIGTIINGAKKSSCLQRTHCLTIDNPKQAKVLPVLNIYENDVMAAHSLSSGTIDEDVMFYMNSRGLNRKEALNLILKSYLMPNEDFYNNYSDGSLIQDKAISKVDQLCLM